MVSEAILKHIKAREDNIVSLAGWNWLSFTNQKRLICIKIFYTVKHSSFHPPRILFCVSSIFHARSESSSYCKPTHVSTTFKNIKGVILSFFLENAAYNEVDGGVMYPFKQGETLKIFSLKMSFIYRMFKNLTQWGIRILNRRAHDPYLVPRKIERPAWQWRFWH